MGILGTVLLRVNSGTILPIFIRSFHELLIQSRGVRRLSVRPSVCKLFCGNRFFSQTNSRIATRLPQDGLQVSLHPGCAQGQGHGQRSRDKGTCAGTKIASSRRQIAGLRPNFHTMISRWARIQIVLKVKVTGSLLIWLHKNRFFFHANGCILTKLYGLFVTFPFPSSVPFSSASNPQMAVSYSLCEYRSSSQ